MEKYKAVPVPHDKDDLFVAIITTEDEKTLIAQCTSLVLARHLVNLHNGSLTKRVRRRRNDNADGHYTDYPA
jgi:hypothetical protein